MKWTARWIKPAMDTKEVVPVFSKKIILRGKVRRAMLFITCMGVYEAAIDGTRIGQYIMAPGWTSYKKRLQYQTYDVTKLLKNKCELTVLVGKGWYRSRLAGWTTCPFQEEMMKNPAGLLAQLEIIYDDDTTEQIVTDKQWTCSESAVRFSELYDGEIYDSTYIPKKDQKVVEFSGPSHTLIPQEGEEICEQEQIKAAHIFTTPKGELVVDFGQEVTGYIRTEVEAKAGEIVDLSFAEVLDKEGNFYSENYRSAKATYHYICREGKQIYKPKLTFWGFRYIRVNQFPGGFDKVDENAFTAIVVHSDMKRTGYLSCSNPLLNKFFSNVIWGQKSNFLDVPTDCPQRDERLGWTGDAQVFMRAACYNYDVEKFFTKWLKDLATDQHEDGRVGTVIPDVLQRPLASTAWGDAATICPYQIYLAYGNPKILRNQFESMKKWIDYITAQTTTTYLWTGGSHYTDWLSLDAPKGSKRGASRADFNATAFYAYSTSLVIKAGHVLGEDVSEYEMLYKKIVEKFRETYPEYTTQTECVLAAYFGLGEDCQKAADQLAEMIVENGTRLQTGFVGTPYLLHVLSDYGYAELAYTLLLREEYPSWLYPVTKGATTVWEHWDSIMEDGSFWSEEMNSFNHYAYGSVIDWVYSVSAGIMPEEAGYKKVRIAPIPDKRLDWLKGTLETRYGVVSSEWRKEKEHWRYEITTPVVAIIVIAGKEYQVEAGTYYFYSDLKES